MPRIKVTQHYIGVDSHNIMIVPGEYDYRDPRIFNLANDLIAIGYATRIDDTPPVDDDPPSPQLSRSEVLATLAQSKVEFVDADEILLNEDDATDFALEGDENAPPAWGLVEETEHTTVPHDDDASEPPAEDAKDIAPGEREGRGGKKHKGK